MNPNFNIGQRVYFLISGRIVTEAVVVAASAGLVTIKFRKNWILYLVHTMFMQNRCM